MMYDDYVKRSDVHKAFQPKYAPAINRTFAAMIDSVPAADVVEVVRCRDCEWWGHAGCAISIVDDTDKPGENDFCSFGERKDGGRQE